MAFCFQTLFSYPDNFRAYKALIAAKYSGAKVKTDLKFVFGETNKSKQFLSKFPFGKVSFEFQLKKSPRKRESCGRCRFPPLKVTTVFASLKAMRLRIMLRMTTSVAARAVPTGLSSTSGCRLPILNSFRPRVLRHFPQWG
jgi:hypothetical protein